MGYKSGAFKLRTDKVRAEIRREFGDLLRRRRIDVGRNKITQDALAEAMGTTRNTVVNIETGRNFPMLDTLYIYLDALSELATGRRPANWKEAFDELFAQHSVPAAFAHEDIEAHRNLAKIVGRGGARAAAIRLILQDECQLLEHLPNRTRDPSPAPGRQGGMVHDDDLYKV